MILKRTPRVFGRNARQIYRQYQHQHHNGFTLVDLLIAMTIIMVVLGIGVPSMSGWLQRSAESTVFNTLHHMATFARTRAIRESAYITMCSSEDNLTCAKEWQHPIIIFVDHNKNEQLDAGEALHKALSLPSSTPCLEWRAGAGRHYLQFKPNGSTNGTAGHFRFCDGVITATSQKLVISFTGRTSFKPL